MSCRSSERLLQRFWGGKSVLVTGASSGLGWAVVEALAPYGVDFGLLARREERLKELAGRLQSTPSRFWIRRCDVTHREEVEQAVADFAQEMGRIDVGWINSGVAADTYRDRYRWEVIEKGIDTNFKGAVYTVRACLDAMSRQGRGTVVAISSVAAMRGLPIASIYSATKVALLSYIEGMAIEYPEIQFTTILPGYVDTPINRGNPGRFFLMQPEEAAQIMIKGVAHGKRIVIFPWQMRCIFHLVRAIPSGVYLPVARRLYLKRRPRKEVETT